MMILRQHGVSTSNMLDKFNAWTIAMQEDNPNSPKQYLPQSGSLRSHDTINTIRPIIPIAIHFATSALSAPLSFATLAVPVAPPWTTTPVAVQLVPQAYPLGQHPPPCPLAQENHPWAHPLAPNPIAAPSVPLGTATVTPSLFTARVEEATGHDVKSQSRPTWQQPA